MRAMKQMTWKEFQETVNKQLKDLGADENVQLEYIDISWPEGDNVNVNISKETGLLAIF